ncbi:hypothetical protein [Lentibacillus salicampi]|uniref:DUF3899 domain-containing protein n=1 Tax=Lentibacillus salicampi TaxID=175306 RepID=A0A4Y9A943_9BACI|nr:hypothetical protein [Lentibacillus salicampi]TFJ92388.1 hypothetical protein E4U82_12615 [Lentibacillus salicampi]
MRKVYIMVMTIGVEALILWAVSRILDWNFVDIIFLGGILIFGAKWLFSLYLQQENNEYIAHIKGHTGQEAGRIKPFEYSVSSVDAGLLLFILGSLLITFATYYTYFI